MAKKKSAKKGAQAAKKTKIGRARDRVKSARKKLKKEMTRPGRILSKTEKDLGIKDKKGNVVASFPEQTVANLRRVNIESAEKRLEKSVSSLKFEKRMTKLRKRGAKKSKKK